MAARLLDRSWIGERPDNGTGHSCGSVRSFTMRRILVLSFLVAVQHAASCTERGKRYLVFPTPGTVTPTKIQVILGLGIPMEVDVSMIIGYTLKINYALPYNASYLTDSYVRYDRSIVPADNDADASDEPGGTTSALNEGLARVISRWEIYEILASILGDSRSGKACLLRAICEASAVPFHGVHGLSSQLVHLLLTPSSTAEPFRTDFDRIYGAAEIMGRHTTRPCRSLFPECSDSPLDYFTETREQAYLVP